jgi:TolA-binding protein
MGNSESQEKSPGMKIEMPANRLMMLVPFLGIMSLAALAVVVVMGITLMNRISAGASISPEESAVIATRLDELSERLTALENNQRDLGRRISHVNRLATELYFAQPPTEAERELSALSDLSAAELLKQGMAALTGEGGRPVPYFEMILDRYPSSLEAATAKLQLGIVYVRNCEYALAAELLQSYLDQTGSASSPESAQANFYLGMAQSGAGRKEEAAAHYEAALKGFPPSDLYRATTLSNLGELYLQLGRSSDAASRFRQLTLEFADEPRAVNMLKRARQRLEEIEQGK